MKVQVANWQLEPLLQKIIAELTSARPLNSLTRLKLTKLRRALAAPYVDYSEQLPAMREEHVATDEQGNFKTQPGDSGPEYVFQSPEDQAAFVQVADAENTITVDMPLTPDDLAEFDTTALQFELFMGFLEADQPSNQPKNED